MEPAHDQVPARSKRPGSSALKQQRLWAFQPIHTFKSSLIIFTILLAIFITFGLLLLLSALKVKEESVRYDNKGNCQNTRWDSEQVCEVEIVIDEKLEEPVYFYYELRNFYQNHRMYVKSRDDKQLAGLTNKGDSKKCDPITSMKDIGKRCSNNTEYCSFSGHPLSESDYASPCGLVARSYFNDTYSLRFGPTAIVIEEKDIAWDSDLEHVFKEADNPEKQWTDVESEHFAVWMRIAAFPTFRKLWGVIHQDLDKGVYTVKVVSKYDVSHWDGEKHLVVSTANRFGGRNPFIGIVYLVAAGVTLLMLIAFTLRGLCQKKEDFDLNNLKWD